MELKLPLEPSLMPMAVAFSETAAKSAHFSERETGLLSVSVEELFLALCTSMPGVGIELTFRDRRYAVEVLFRIPQPPPDLRVFNITSRPDHESDEGLADMGLFLASRAADQFGIRRLPGNEWEIMLRKERQYPAAENALTSAEQPVGAWQLSPSPSPVSIKALSGLIAARYRSVQFPEEFTPPGRLLDKIACGDYGVLLAEDGQGAVAGGLVWRTTEQQIVECFGPYCAAAAPDRERLATELCEAATALFGRSRRIGMVLYAPVQPPADAGFEPAGTLSTPEGQIWAGYRMMREEFGATAYLAPELTRFYTDASAGMALARDIREYHDDGEAGDGLTLFATRINRTTGLAQLNPLLTGRDAASALDEHLALFDSSGFSTTVCLIDTGRPFDALLVPHLLKSGFMPGMLVPWGGTGDLVYLERRSAR